MKFFLIISVVSFFALTSCNTVMGTAKGVGRDVKAVYIYSRDAVSGRPVSDK